MDGARALVLDNGGCSCKVGFAGDSAPGACVPASSSRWDCDGSSEFSPYIRHGKVVNEKRMTEIWSIAFQKIRANPRDHPVLVTESPLLSTSNRAILASLLFETFQVPGLHIAIPGLLALYATGSLTGLVADSGDGVSYTVPICDGYVFPHAVQRVSLGGRALTERFGRLLGESRFDAVLCEAKERLCYVAQDCGAELAAARKGSSSGGSSSGFALPDGKRIEVGAESFMCPEALFQPGLHDPGLEDHGLQDLVHRSISSSEVDVRGRVAANVVLVGGTMQLRGMKERMTSELMRLLPALPATVKVVSDAANASFVGGSIVASAPKMIMWITRAEYEEFGQDVVVKKFPSLHSSTWMPPS